MLGEHFEQSPVLFRCCRKPYDGCKNALQTVQDALSSWRSVRCRFHALQVEGFLCEGDVECMQVLPVTLQHLDVEGPCVAPA